MRILSQGRLKPLPERIKTPEKTVPKTSFTGYIDQEFKERCEVPLKRLPFARWALGLDSGYKRRSPH